MTLEELRLKTEEAAAGEFEGFTILECVGLLRMLKQKEVMLFPSPIIWSEIQEKRLEILRYLTTKPQLAITWLGLRSNEGYREDLVERYRRHLRDRCNHSRHKGCDEGVCLPFLFAAPVDIYSTEYSAFGGKSRCVEVLIEDEELSMLDYLFLELELSR